MFEPQDLQQCQVAHRYLAIQSFHPVTVQMNPSETEWILISETQKPDACPVAPKSAAPLPVPHSHLAHRQYPGPALTLGGLPIPIPKARAKSATVPLPVRIPLSGDATVLGPVDPSFSRSLPSSRTGLSFPLLPVGTSKRQQTKTSGQLLRLQHPSQSDWLVQQWSAILKNLVTALIRGRAVV